MNPWDAYAREVGPPDDARSRKMEARLLEGVKRRERRQTVGRVGAAVAAVAAALLVWLVLRAESPPLEVVPMTVATQTAPQTMALPRDGWLEAEPDTRLEVEASVDTGADVRLLAGGVTLDVRPGEGLRWVVRSGAYRVEALGTRFRVRARAGAPEVTVFEGVVRVVGPDLPDEGLRVTPTQVAAAATVTPEEEVPVATPDPEPDPATASDRAPAPASPERPRKTAADALNEGDALAAANRHQAALRSYALACQRDPQSKACAVASYRRALVLARIGKRKQAIRQASRYLERYPRGALARQALAHRMKWRAAAGQRSAAAEDARTYLRRWPDGPDAAAAKEISAR